MNIKNKGLKCKAEQCNKLAFCKGFCTKHYQQLKFNGKVKEQVFLNIEGFCKNIGCGRQVFVKGLCQRCYSKERMRLVNAD